MPKPTPNETKDDFLNRCMGDEEALNDFPENDQRYAVCNSMWEESKMSALSKYSSGIRREKLTPTIPTRCATTHAEASNSTKSSATNVRHTSRQGQRAAARKSRSPFQWTRSRECIRIYPGQSLTFEDSAPEDCGYVSFLLWGGKDWIRIGQKVNLKD